MVLAAVMLFHDVRVTADAVPSVDVQGTAAVVVLFDDVLVAADVLPVEGELAIVLPSDDVKPVTSAVVEVDFVEGNVDPGETWFLLFLVCLTQELQS